MADGSFSLAYSEIQYSVIQFLGITFFLQFLQLTVDSFQKTSPLHLPLWGSEKRTVKEIITFIILLIIYYIIILYNMYIIYTIVYIR